MKQFFTDGFKEECYLQTKPYLFYASQVLKEDNIFPRILHAHHDFLELILVTSGAGHYFIHDKTYPIKKGDLIILNCNVIHDEQIDEDPGMSIYCCAIKNLQYLNFPASTLPLPNNSPVIHVEQHFEALAALFKLIFETLSVGDVSGQYIAQNLTESLLSYVHHRILKNKEHLIPQHTPSKNTIEDEDEAFLTQRVKNYIDTNFQKEINLQVLATMFNISPYYLSHLFKEDYGYSPIQYALRRRIGEAQTLLLTTDKMILDIALEIGYDNVGNFNLVFKKKVGMTPSEYRKKYLKL